LLVEHGFVMHEQRRPLTVALQLGERTLDEEPFESPQGAGERFTVDQLQGFAREQRRVPRGEFASRSHQRVEVLHVTRDPVCRVETERRHGVQPATSVIGAEAASDCAGGVGEGTRGRVDVGVTEHARAQPLASDGFAPVQRQIRHHLDAASA